MAKYSNVASVREEHATLNESTTLDDGITATVVLRCPWADRWSVVSDVLGPTALPYPNVPVGWVPPYPFSCTIAPDATKFTTDADEQIIIYEEALITIDYRYFELQTVTQPHLPSNVKVSETIEPNVEMINVRTKGLRWNTRTIVGKLAGGGPLFDWEPLDPEDQVVTRIKKSMVITRTLSPVYSLPISLLNNIGGVNDAPYTSAMLGLTFPTETLLYEPPHISRTIQASGSNAWTLTLKFHYDSGGWNSKFRDDRDESGNVIGFDSVDLWWTDAAGVTQIDPVKFYELKDFSEWLW